MRRSRRGSSCCQCGIVLGLLFLVSMLLITQASLAAAQARFSWRQSEGTTLHLLLSQSHWQQVIAPRLPEFEQLTGIKLVTEVYPQGQLWDLLENGLKAPGRIDVFMTLPALDGLRYLRAGGIQSVKDYLQNPLLTSSDYNWEDFFPSTRAAMEIEGAIIGPPVMAEHLAVFYRKDLFKQHQLSVPRTLEELEAAARLLHNKPMGPGGIPGFGVVSRGKGANVTSLYAAYLHALGGTWLDGSRRTTINTAPSIQALERLGRLLGNYAPPNVSDYDWQEASALFMDGKAAMYIEGSSVFPLIEHSGKSRVAGQVGYAMFPGGPGGPGTTIAVRGLAVAKQSANPSAAWLFVQWASSPEMVRKALVGDILVARQSAWRDKYYWDGIPPDLVESFQQAARIGVPTWAPPVVAVAAARETIGKVITAAIRGEDIRGAAAAAAQRLRDVQ